MSAIPLLIAGILNNDYFHKFLRKVKVTSKTYRLNTWNYVLLSENRHVVLHLKDDRRVRGYPTKFSNDSDEGYIYLFNPAWINEERQGEDDPYYIESGAHGYLLNKSEIELIEFTLNEGEVLDPDKRS